MEKRGKKIFIFVIFVVVVLTIYNYTNVHRDHTNMPAGSCRGKLDENEQWLAPPLPASMRRVKQENPDLINEICNKWLLPPSTRPRTLSQPDQIHYSQEGQSLVLDKLLQGKRNGFFVDSGAGDGELLSNSLFFEKSRGWSGLLIEPDPRIFQQLIGKHRHCHMINACLSPSRTPDLVSLLLGKRTGALVDFVDPKWREHLTSFQNSTTIKAQCFPLFSILKALRVTHVDYWSLDIDGPETSVLQTLPLDQITVDVFSIEYRITGDPEASEKRLKDIEDYLVNKHGYKIVEIVSKLDVILMKS